MASPFARAVDVVRKRYKRQVARYEKLSRTSTGAARESALRRKEQAQKAIEALKYDRSSRSYGFGTEELSQREFASERGNVLGRERLSLGDNNSRFYAATRDLWRGASNGTVDQTIIANLRKMGYDVNSLDEAVEVVERITGQDFTSPQEETNEFERYDQESVKEAMIGIAKEKRRKRAK